jgi:hypothetical protein
MYTQNLKFSLSTEIIQCCDIMQFNELIADFKNYIWKIWKHLKIMDIIVYVECSCMFRQLIVR